MARNVRLSGLSLERPSAVSLALAEAWPALLDEFAECRRHWRRLEVAPWYAGCILRRDQRIDSSGPLELETKTTEEPARPTLKAFLRQMTGAIFDGGDTLGQPRTYGDDYLDLCKDAICGVVIAALERKDTARATKNLRRAAGLTGPAHDQIELAVVDFVIENSPELMAWPRELFNMALGWGREALFREGVVEASRQLSVIRQLGEGLATRVTGLAGGLAELERHCSTSMTVTVVGSNGDVFKMFLERDGAGNIRYGDDPGAKGLFVSRVVAEPVYSTIVLRSLLGQTDPLSGVALKALRAYVFTMEESTLRFERLLPDDAFWAFHTDMQTGERLALRTDLRFPTD